MANARPLAVVTGASSGIGYELALVCARNGFDLVVAANEPEIRNAAETFRKAGATLVEAVQAELATTEGNDQLYAAAERLGRPVDALLANAGSGLGHAFLDQPWDGIRQTIDTNVTGTTYLLHRIGRDMRRRGEGRILITGSIAGFMPGTFQAVYNASKAYLNSLSFALREELAGTKVTVTVLQPGATDTPFFARAGMLDTKIGQAKKDDPAMVAEKGFQAMMKGSSDITTGLKNKIQAAVANVVPNELLAKAHRTIAAPGSGKT
jgi:short-subunit dehydrogenase